MFDIVWFLSDTGSLSMYSHFDLLKFLWRPKFKCNKVLYDQFCDLESYKKALLSVHPGHIR